MQHATTMNIIQTLYYAWKFFDETDLQENKYYIFTWQGYPVNWLILVPVVWPSNSPVLFTLLNAKSSCISIKVDHSYWITVSKKVHLQVRFAISPKSSGKRIFRSTFRAIKMDQIINQFTQNEFINIMFISFEKGCMSKWKYIVCTKPQKNSFTKTKTSLLKALFTSNAGILRNQ